MGELGMARVGLELREGSGHPGEPQLLEPIEGGVGQQRPLLNGSNGTRGDWGGRAAPARLAGSAVAAAGRARARGSTGSSRRSGHRYRAVGAGADTEAAAARRLEALDAVPARQA